MCLFYFCCRPYTDERKRLIFGSLCYFKFLICIVKIVFLIVYNSASSTTDIAIIFEQKKPIPLDKQRIQATFRVRPKYIIIQ